MAKPQRPQNVLSVLENIRLSPTMVRIVAGGPGFATIVDNDSTDKYAKLVFVRPELGLTPPYDVEALRDALPESDWPVVRTYTIRAIDESAQTVTVDFVIHGDEGVAGPWAAAAKPGEPLVFMGPAGGYRPDPEADWHLLAGDQSALPAISSALEALPADARGVVYVEVSAEEEQQELTVPTGLELVWVLSPGHGADPEPLAEAIGAGVWLDGEPQVFAHGERESMKLIRRLLKERGVSKDRISLSGYWAYGRTEQRFQAEKREPIGQIDD